MPEQSTSDTTTIDVDEHQFHLAYERLEPVINAVSEDDLEPINLDIPSAVATVLGAEPEVRPLRTSLAALATFDIENVDQLRDRALALGHTHTQVRIAGGEVDDTDELVEAMVDARDRFHTDASALVRRGLLDAERVNKLRGGNSHRMIAFDVIGLVALFLENWDRISGKTAMDVGELEDARAQANRLVVAVGLREQGPTQRNAAALVRQKAYTLFVRAYNETRQAVAFVRRREGDVDDITPSLYAGRGKRPPEPPIVVPEPTPRVSEPDAGADDAATTEVPVGFPGAPPFARS